LVPSPFINQRSRPREKTIVVPSGDIAGDSSSRGLVVSRVGFPPLIETE
jgi:hypothetical protein